MTQTVSPEKNTATTLATNAPTQDGIHVTQSTTLDDGAPPRRLLPGRHEGSVAFEGLRLLPRGYTLDVGIHHWDGATSDLVSRSLDFTVLRMAESGNDHYPWPMTRGHIRPAARWGECRAS